MNGQLQLIGGKFMRDGVEVPPRIGDDEQITLLRRAERHLAWLEQQKDKGIPFDTEVTGIEYDATISFECLCGADICQHRTFNACDIDDIDPENDFDRLKVACCKCGSIYEILGDVALIVK